LFAACCCSLIGGVMLGAIKPGGVFRVGSPDTGFWEDELTSTTYTSFISPSDEKFYELMIFSKFDDCFEILIFLLIFIYNII
jgi:hypothetical protein